MTSARFTPLRELGALFQQIPGARTETRTVPDVCDREVAVLLDAHRARSPAAAALLRLANWKLGQHDAKDDAIFAAELTLDEARRAVARFHRFPAWADVLLQAHATVDPRFEAAADAIVAGDDAALRVLLAQAPELVRARSPFGHHATLLHHVAANDVEESRQWQSPPNAVQIAEMLLRAGADPDATCNSYGGGATTMTLLVSSEHPARAGTQVALVEALLDGGASVDGTPGEVGPPIATAVAFGCPAAAEALARRGARIDDVVVAAGLGRLPLIERLAGEAPARVDEAFRVACMLGQVDAVRMLLPKGVHLEKQDNQGFTGLHWAAFYGHADIVKVLLERRAPLEIENAWRGTVLDATAWAAVHAGLAVDHAPIVEQLVAAGARVEAVRPFPTGHPQIDTVLRAAGKN